MKSLAGAMAAVLIACAPSYGATANFSHTGSSVGSDFNNIFHFVANNSSSTTTDSGELISRSTGELQLDDVADVGTLVGASVTQTPTVGNSIPTVQIPIGPPNFPNPNPTLVSFDQMVTIDSFSVSGSIAFVAGGSAPLVPVNGSEFVLSSPLTLAFPDSFTLTGVYKIVGPTTTVTTPYSVVYSRSTASQVTRSLSTRITPGANYPSTGSVNIHGNIGVAPSHNATYTPSIVTLYDGSVDGVSFKATFRNTNMRAFAASPEPSSLTIAALAAIGLGAAGRRRRSSPSRAS